jgi:hypothetical protein
MYLEVTNISYWNLIWLINLENLFPYSHIYVGVPFVENENFNPRFYNHVKHLLSLLFLSSLCTRVTTR